MAIKVNNKAKLAKKKGSYDYYDWELYLDEDESTLKNIDHVVYILHETFPEPIRTVSEPDSKFAVQARGWGEFDVGVQVVYKDGSTANEKYRLDLSKSWV